MATAVGNRSSAALPQGAVTFLLTDVEGSSRLWETDEDAMRHAMAVHDAVLDEARVAFHGARQLEQGEGDSAVLAFVRATDAVACALEIQRRLAAASWPAGFELRVRIGIHSGEARLRDEGRYGGETVVRCARLRAIGHGGQTLLSRAAAELAAPHLPDGASLVPLGIHRLKSLARPEDVFELRHRDLVADFPPLRSLDALPNNLPAQLSNLVGREAEIAEIAELLSEVRMVTLVGAGGCGKTRLAAHVAAEIAEDHPDGAWWVDLAPLGDPALVVSAAAAVVSVRELPGTGLLDTLTARLQGHRTLLVFDNCEHVVAEAASLCERLLRACPGVSIIATSREPLGVEGERTYRVESLAVPPPGATLAEAGACHAVRLFAERAREVRPHFEVTEERWAAVADICRRLDGLPLAIELAAARTRVLSAEQVAEGLSSRFTLLAGGRRTAVPRQQTLHHSVDWSHDLLDEPERAVLRRASVFAGGFDLEAAEAVCAGDGVDGYGVLDLLSRLVDKSLVQAEERGAAVRYRLLETIRQYAAERLTDTGEAAAARDRHLDHYLRLAEAASAELEGHDQLTWFERLALEHDNLRAAGDWASARGDEREVALVAALGPFWSYRGYVSEALERIDAALAGGAGEARARGTALVESAEMRITTGDFARSRARAEDALSIGRETADPVITGRALAELSWSELMEGGPGARAMMRSAVESLRDSGDEPQLAFALCSLGYLEILAGDASAARAALDEGIARARESGGGRALEAGLLWWGEFLAETGRFGESEDALREGIETATALGHPTFLSMFHSILGLLSLRRGQTARARASLDRALAVAEESFNPLAAALAGGFRCWLEALAGDPADGIDAGGQAVEFGRTMGLRVFTGRWLAAYAHAVHATGDADAATECWEESAAIGREAGDPWAGLSLLGLAALARERGDHADAERLAHEALAGFARAELWTLVVECLESLAASCLELGASERAARLLGAAEAERARRGQPRLPGHERRLEAVLERLRAAELGEARAAGAEMSLGDAVEYASRGRGSRERPAGGWESLTPAELRVVELAAQGLTNPQIGERLFISRRTVQAHLAHVFAKLGVASRAELAAEAARRGA